MTSFALNSLAKDKQRQVAVCRSYWRPHLFESDESSSQATSNVMALNPPETGHVPRGASHFFAN